MRTSVAARPDPLLLADLRALPTVVRPDLRPAGSPPLATGLAPLDALLGGGFPPGRISEVVGPPTSGRTSLVLSTLARATADGALAALVDASDALDPVSARGRGVALDRLLWVRCGGRLGTALQAADVVVRGGGFAVVVVDLGHPSPWALARIPAAAVVRLQRAVAGTPTACLFTGPRRVAGSLSALAIGLARGRADWRRGGPALLAGLEVEARVIRSRTAAPGAAVRVRWSAA
jgi:hypothetical protein